MSIRSNIEKIKAELPASVELVAISKTKPAEDILEAKEAGQFHFGENKVQEMVEKQAKLPPTLFWHQVGTLQRNKVKYIAPFVHLIHSVENFKLLEEINRQAEKNQRQIGILLQMHIAREETKFGMNEEELFALLEDKALASLNNVMIHGLMGMATNTKDENLIAAEFRGLRALFDGCKKAFEGHPLMRFDTLSMGMSSDYPIAVKEGSTMVRVGSALFGDRH